MCNAPTMYNGAVLSGMMCAGLSQGGVDACQVNSRPSASMYKHSPQCHSLLRHLKIHDPDFTDKILSFHLSIYKRVKEVISHSSMRLVSNRVLYT